MTPTRPDIVLVNPPKLLTAARPSLRRLTLLDLVKSREASYGEPQAVLLADPVAEPVLIDGFLADAIPPRAILQWLTTFRRRPDDPPPSLVVRLGKQCGVVPHAGVDDASGDVLIYDSSFRHLVVRALSGKHVEGNMFRVPHSVLLRMLVAAVILRRNASDNYGTTPSVPKAEMPLNIYDKRIPSYHERGGAPLEQVWRTSWRLIGIPPMCLMHDHNCPEVNRIPYQRRVDAASFVGLLHKAVMGGATPVLAVTFGDGGHAVTVKGFSNGRFKYQEPRPGRSLLCRENNTLGVAAVHVAGQEWEVTSAELATVSVAANLSARYWHQLTGEGALSTLTELIESESGRHFGLHPGDRTPADFGSVVELIPGGFTDAIQIFVSTDHEGRVIWGTLLVARAMLADPARATFALDLIKGFLGALPPAEDVPELEMLRASLAYLMRHKPAQARDAASSGHPHLVEFQQLALLALFGGFEQDYIARAYISLLFSSIIIRNHSVADVPYLIVDVVSWWARPIHARYAPGLVIGRAPGLTLIAGQMTTLGSDHFVGTVPLAELADAGG
jgi:hypothetical protein